MAKKLLAAFVISIVAVALWILWPQSPSLAPSTTPEVTTQPAERGAPDIAGRRESEPASSQSPAAPSEEPVVVERIENPGFPGESYEADLLSALAHWRVQSAARAAEASRSLPALTFLDEAGIIEQLAAAGIAQADAERIANQFGDDLAQCEGIRSVWLSGDRMNNPCILNAAQEAGLTAELVNAIPPVVPRPQPEIDSRQFFQDFGGGRVQLQYPGRAASIGQEGWVVVEFSANTVGCVTEAGVADSSPEGFFEDAVLAGFNDFCFPQPKIDDGKPVAVVDYPVLFSFKLAP